LLKQLGCLGHCFGTPLNLGCRQQLLDDAVARVPLFLHSQKGSAKSPLTEQLNGAVAVIQQ
jgi:hypothetical protein